MVYRFDRDWNGEVIAEERRERPQPVPRPALPGHRHPGPGPPAVHRQLDPADRRRRLRRRCRCDPVRDPGDPRPAGPVALHAAQRLADPPRVPAQHGRHRLDVDLARHRRRAVGPDRLPPLLRARTGRARTPGRRPSSSARWPASRSPSASAPTPGMRRPADPRSMLARIVGRVAASQRPALDALIDDPELLELMGATGVAMHDDGASTTRGDVPPPEAARGDRRPRCSGPRTARWAHTDRLGDARPARWRRTTTCPPARW